MIFLKNITCRNIGKILLLGVISFSLSNCTAFVKKPTPPSVPSFAPERNLEINWPSPEKPEKYKYIAFKDSQNPMTIDNVSVEIISIVKGLTESNYSINCKGPNGDDIVFPIFPVAAQLKITNHTNHILALGQTAMLTGTVIRLEDVEGNEYPLYSGENWRSDAREIINSYYEQCRSVVNKSFDLKIEKLKANNTEILNSYRKGLYGPYANEYDKYVSDFETQSMLECINPLVWIGLALTGTYPDESYDRSISPKNLDQKNTIKLVGELQEIVTSINKRRSELLLLISRNERDCLYELEKLKPTGIITRGDYPEIIVFPGKSQIMYVPFIKKKGEYLEKIRFMLYDLATQFDRSGMPTKRSNFDIRLRRVE